MRFLSTRPRSEAEVRNRLARSGFAAQVTERTLQKLRALNYLNDETFARNWAQGRTERRRFGPRRIEAELRQRGIAIPLIRDVLRETFAAGGEEENAKRLLERKFGRQNLEDPKLLRRAIAFLQRRGYGQRVIVELLRGPVEND